MKFTHGKWYKFSYGKMYFICKFSHVESTNEGFFTDVYKWDGKLSSFEYNNTIPFDILTESSLEEWKAELV